MHDDSVFAGNQAFTAICHAGPSDSIRHAPA